MTETYRISGWQDDYRHWRAPLHKLAIYALTRPLLSLRARRSLPPGSLLRDPDYVFFTRGSPPQWRRRWGTRGLNLRGATILVQGAGTGWDALTWAEQQPAKIIATDLYAFPADWAEIERYARDKFGVSLTFHEAPMESHDFIADGSIDLCTSHNVLEHCRDMSGVLAESKRLLRPGGLLFADFDPMWFAPGGDHYSGRGRLEEVYNHLLLDRPDYEVFFKKYALPVEDFQNGGRYVEIDLFSKLTTNRYIEFYRQAGFEIDGLVVELSPIAFAFRERYAGAYAALLRKTAHLCQPIDLCIKGNIVRLRRPG